MSGSLGTPIGGGFLGSAGTLPVTVNANVIYVSANGDDANPGTWIGKPKQTLAAALAASASGDKVYVLDGVFADATIPIVPAGVTVEFANKFVGGLVLSANSIAIVPVHTCVPAFGAPFVEMLDNISAAADAPTYVCNVLDSTGLLINNIIESGTNSFSNIYIKKALVNGHTLLYNEAGSGFSGEVGLVQFTAANSVALESAGAAGGSSITISNCYDAGVHANCTFLKFAVGSTGHYHAITSNNVYLSGAGAKLTDWALAMGHTVDMVTSSLPAPLPDYANGTANIFWPGLVANANTAGLAPISTNTGVAVLTDTDPVTYV